MTPDRTTRRTFDFVHGTTDLSPYFTTTGSIKLRFVHFTTYQEQFRSHYDLVQAMTFTECSEGIGGESAMAMGGDYNCNGESDGDDLAAFMADFADGAPGADFNGDEQIDGADVGTFAEQWSGSGG